MMSVVKKFSCISVLLASVFLINSCATKNSDTSAAFSSVLSQNKEAVNTLDSYGVSIMRLGDQLQLTIPSRELFKGYSVDLSPSGQQVLQAVLQLLQSANKVSIHIAAYAESPIQTEKDLFLTEKQAQVISNYLWDHAIDARLLTANGYGGGHPVQYEPNAALNDIAGDKENYRVEISLKDYVG